MKLTMASFALLTPYPGTPLFHRLTREGRLTNPKWWLGSDHDEGSPYFVPKQMTRTQLREGWIKAWKQFYTYSSMWRRFTLRRSSSWIQAAGYWPLNFMQNRLAHYKIAGGKQRFRTNLVDRIFSRGEEPVAPLAKPTPVGFSELTPARTRLPLVD